MLFLPHVHAQKKPGERTPVRIVESCRREGKPRRRVRRHVGTACGEEQTVSLERHAQILMRDLAKNTASQPTLFHAADRADLIGRKRRADGAPPERWGVDAMDIVHHRQVSIGAREAFGAVLSGFGRDRLFGLRHRGAGRVVQELALARIIQPLSRRAAGANGGSAGLPCLRP